MAAKGSAAQPAISAGYESDYLCHFHAPLGGSDGTNLVVYNFGDAVLSIAVTGLSTGSWLSVTGLDFEVDPYPAPPATIPVNMDATSLSEGIYTGNIVIEHNDPFTPNPVKLPVEFLVDADYLCADTVKLRTAVASPGVLELNVGSNGRHGYSNYAGLYRETDGSWSLYDATLVVGHGPQTSDTTMFYSIYGGAANVFGDPGGKGFLTTSAMAVDTSAYGTGTGNATVAYSMKTKDEALSIDVEWYFPQDPDSADFVLAKYTVKNISAAPVSDIVVGQFDDFDVTPGTLFTSYQDDTRNHGDYVAADNLIYQYGYTTPGLPTDPPLGLAERYSAGVAYLAGRDYISSGSQFENTPILLTGGTDNLDDFSDPYFDGTGSNYLYERFMEPAGVTIWEGYPDADSSSDLITYMCLDRGLSLNPNGTQSYVIALVSDTLDNPGLSAKSAAAAGLLETAAKATAWASNHGITGSEPCACPNQGDSEPDGFLTSLDLSACIDILFAGAEDIQDSGCPSPRFDLDCDGFSTSLDLTILIDHLFATGPGPCDPCGK
jgi:hypothetical protein